LIPLGGILPRNLACEDRPNNCVLQQNAGEATVQIKPDGHGTK